MEHEMEEGFSTDHERKHHAKKLYHRSAGHSNTDTSTTNLTSSDEEYQEFLKMKKHHDKKHHLLPEKKHHEKEEHHRPKHHKEHPPPHRSHHQEADDTSETSITSDDEDYRLFHQKMKEKKEKEKELLKEIKVKEKQIADREKEQEKQEEELIGSTEGVLVTLDDFIKDTEKGIKEGLGDSDVDEKRAYLEKPNQAKKDKTEKAPTEPAKPKKSIKDAFYNAGQTVYDKIQYLSGNQESTGHHGHGQEQRQVNPNMDAGYLTGEKDHEEKHATGEHGDEEHHDQEHHEGDHHGEHHEGEHHGGHHEEHHGEHHEGGHHGEHHEGGHHEEHYHEGGEDHHEDHHQEGEHHSGGEHHGGDHGARPAHRPHHAASIWNSMNTKIKELSNKMYGTKCPDRHYNIIHKKCKELPSGEITQMLSWLPFTFTGSKNSDSDARRDNRKSLASYLGFDRTEGKATESKTSFFHPTEGKAPVKNSLLEGIQNTVQDINLPYPITNTGNNKENEERAKKVSFVDTVSDKLQAQATSFSHLFSGDQSPRAEKVSFIDTISDKLENLSLTNISGSQTSEEKVSFVDTVSSKLQNLNFTQLVSDNSEAETQNKKEEEEADGESEVKEDSISCAYDRGEDSKAKFGPSCPDDYSDKPSFFASWNLPGWGLSDASTNSTNSVETEKVSFFRSSPKQTSRKKESFISKYICKC